MSIVKRPPSNKHTTVRCDAQVKKACSWPAAEGTVNIAITTREQGAKNVPKSEDDNEGAQNVGDNLRDRSQGTGLSHQRDYVTHKVINGVEPTERQLRELYSGDRATKQSEMPSEETADSLGYDSCLVQWVVDTVLPITCNDVEGICLSCTKGSKTI